MKTQTSNARRLTESGLMIALSVILSFVKLVDLPYGGSITLASMVPMIVLAYRYGTAWGLFSSFVYGLIQFVIGSSILSYATSAGAAIAIIAFDYLLAFAAMGLGGVFRGKMKNTAAIALGAFLACFIRYLMHVISGCTVWAGLSIPTNDALIYSIIYNATYMLPETIVTIVASIYLVSLLDFTKEKLAPVKTKEDTSKASRILTAVAGAAVVVGIVVLTVLVFPQLQNADTGSFDITGIANVSGTGVLITVVVTAFVSIGCLITGKTMKTAAKGTTKEE